MDIDPILNAREQGSMADAMMDFFDELFEAVERVGLDATPQSVRLACLVAAVDAAMNNDGVEELSQPPVAGRTADVKAALKTMGLDQMSALLDNAMQEPTNMAHLDAWAGYPDDVETRLAEWIEQHADDFRRFG